jgi:hypothetical protein
MAANINPIASALSIGLLGFNYHKWLSGLKVLINRLLWLAITTIKQELRCPGITLLGLGMQGQQYLLSSSEAILILLAKHIGKQDVKVRQLRWSATAIVASCFKFTAVSAFSHVYGILTRFIFCA